MAENDEIESEFIQLVRERWDVEGDMTVEDENNLIFLLNGPEHYQVEPEMLAYAKQHPNATTRDMLTYFTQIVPPGLAPGDDGADLLED